MFLQQSELYYKQLCLGKDKIEHSTPLCFGLNAYPVLGYNLYDFP